MERDGKGLKSNNKGFYGDPRRLAIKNLDKDKYPALYKMLFQYWQDKLFKTLEYYWMVQDTKPKQYYRPGGYYEFIESRRHSAFKAPHISRDHRVWQRNTVLLHCLGLISTRRPRRKDGEWLPPIEHQSIVIMLKKGHRQPSTYITTQLWELDMLEYSEAQAQKWVDNRTPVKYLTKEIIINVFGQELANKVYCDDRGVPASSAEANEKLKQAIISTSKAKGYTTKGKLLTQAAKGIGKMKADKAWSVYGRQVMDTIGYRYHKPSKADKARYGIRANDNRWIIDKVEPASPRVEKEALAEEMNEVTNG